MRTAFFLGCIIGGIGVLAQAEDKTEQKKSSTSPDPASLETIQLSYRVTDDGLEFTWTPANAEPSGGIKLTCSETNPKPLYPQDGYVAWLPGTGKTSCRLPMSKAASSKARYYRVCSVHKDDHSRYVALSQVISIEPIGTSKSKTGATPSKPTKTAQAREKPTPSKTSYSKPAAESPPAISLRRPSTSLSVGHSSTDLSQIPIADIENARRWLHVWYGHTSHGSQITSGMEAMNRAPYLFNRNGSDGALRYEETGGDLGNAGDDHWEHATRRYLDRGGKANVIMWSWCGGCSHNTPEGVQGYLDRMSQLERDYPGRVFVYMTGHLDGTGSSGNLHRVNEQIRAYCRANNKVLFDFADIESYDPSGASFLDLQADDGCQYIRSGKRGNWAQEWIAAHPDHDFSLPARAAHTHPLNAALKGRAFWALLARLAAIQES